MDKIEAGLKKYCYIMERLHKIDVSTDRDFQKAYNGFYRLRQRSADFYACYYGYLEQQKNNAALNFEDVLTYLYENTGRVEASFSSKLLATVRPELPIWDSFVLKNLGLRAPNYNCKNRLRRVAALYDQICRWYQSGKAAECVAEFDGLYPGTNITDTKKADFILWQRREQIHIRRRKDGQIV